MVTEAKGRIPKPMHIVARARAFVESLMAIGRRRDVERRRCRTCQSTQVYKHGRYTRHPYTLEGRQTIAVQRYCCQSCGATHSDEHPDLPPGGWYARSVRRYAIDHWLHAGSSLRRVAEMVRSLIGRQERWHFWHIGSAPDPVLPRCRLSHSTVHYWLDQAGRRAESQVEGIYKGVPASRRMGTDGLWARLRGGVVRVLLLLRDSVTGLLWPPVVAAAEEAAVAWAGLFTQAQKAGLVLEDLRAVVSDGAQGLLSYLRDTLPRVYQQRCIFHLWRNLSRELARQAAQAAEALEDAAAQEARTRVRRELTALVHRVVDAEGFAAAEEALAQLKAHPQGGGLWKVLNARFIELLTHLMDDHHGVGRVTPEWMWRDFRLRLSRGRNHGSHARLQRAGLIFTIYRNFTPAQQRRERARHYRHPGKSALAVAGVAPEGCSYLDALQV
jgi:transposase-like protein